MRPNYLGKVALLATLYLLTGKLGLLLAVPPGYATIIWPASGIALGLLLVHGARLWPGVLVGSFLLNAFNSGAFADATWSKPKIAAALLIAVGSTLQALAGRALIKRMLGLPLRLDTIRDVFWVLGIGGPLACVLAATIGVTTLYGLDILSRDDLATNWLAWWSGDALGVLVFMPLVLLAPGSRDQLTWRGASIGQLPLASILLLLLPLGLTFYAWKAATENDYQRGQAKFQALAGEGKKALETRIASYGNALLGAAGFVQGSKDVSRDEWRTYVRTIEVRENFHGLHGLGWVVPVAENDLDSFTRSMRADGAAGFTVHPAVEAGPWYVIGFIEPDDDNRAALGLNIAFEKKRLAAAQLARDSGQPTMSAKVVLVQDERKSPGFLLLFPVYRADQSLMTIEQRRAAFRGWTYAPFVAHDSLDDLTHSQHSELRLRIYDGEDEDPDALIFASESISNARPAYATRATVDIMQRRWLLVFESTPEFELAERLTNPLFILIGGLLFTALLALLLIVVAVRRTDQLEQMVGERRFALPLLVFVVLSMGSVVIHSKLRSQELAFVLRQVQDEASKVGSLLRSQADERVAALGRMAARWEAGGGTDEQLWRRDAQNHVEQLPGLRALEWIDPTYHVRWVEPLGENHGVVGLNVLSDPLRAAALRGAADRRRPTLTPPLKVVQGYNAFIAYIPLRRGDRFDGFVAGVFAISDFFHGAMRSELSRNFAMSILHHDIVYFSDADVDDPPVDWVTESQMRIQDQAWTLRIAPTKSFVESQESDLPSLVLIAGLLVAALSALSVRYILISRLNSAHLAKSLALNAGIISSSAHLVIAIDDDYRIMIFNKAAEQALGFTAAEVTGRRAIPIFLDPGELEDRSRTLSAELGETVPVGPGIFTRIPLRDGFESREWAFVRKDGSRFPANVTITPLRDVSGALTGFLGVIEDITVRKDVERLKSEFTAVVSHELRTPLTSIRGSLGLILGALVSTLQPKVKSLLEIAQSNCERLVLLVDDILDIEKFSAGQMRFELQTLPLAALVRQAVEANEGYARKFQVQIELAPTDATWAVTVDPDRFIQVMSNLLSNAAKYSPQGGTVRVTTGRHDDAARISVSDDGPGIPESFRERIFEKFSQADSSSTREKGGTGLGLHIARRFVEHMHGRIGFDCAPGHGTVFWIELPLAPVAVGS